MEAKSTYCDLLQCHQWNCGYVEDWRLRARDSEGRGGGSQGTRSMQGLLGLVGKVKVLVDTTKREH